jgi:class 3 adenylate cyclase
VSKEDIVDISGADLGRGDLRRRLVRILVPVLCVVLMMASILGIALYSYSKNRADALHLSEDLLRSLDRQIAIEVRNYLSPATAMVDILQSTLKDPQFRSGWRTLVEPLAMQMLQAYPQLAMFNLGVPSGEFMMCKKMPDGSIDTKVIRREGGTPGVTWIRRNTEGRILETERMDWEGYDPRVRPWYKGARETSGVYWTDIYIFFTDQKPGITASKALRGENGELLGVVSLDIELENLSRFLSELRIGRNGRAMIIDDTGHLVAFPEPERIIRKKQGEFVPVRLDELDEPVLTRAFSRFRIQGTGHRELRVGGETYINTVSSLRSMIGRRWAIMIVVPAGDFVGFVSRNYRKAMFMSVGVLLLASGMAGLLIWQGLRADRNARWLLSRRREMETQSRAFSDLAAQPAVFDPSDISGLEDLTRTAAESCAVRRVSVWQWHGGGQRLICADCYDRESGGHTRGMVLSQEGLPRTFEALKQEGDLPAPDASQDPRLAELQRAYLDPMGCYGILSTPIVVEHANWGLLWLEQDRAKHRWKSEEISFARALAGLLALRLRAGQSRDECAAASGTEDAVARPSGSEPATPYAAGPAGDDVGDHSETMRQASVLQVREQVFRKEVEERAASTGALAADIFEDVTILVLKIEDALALAEQPDSGTRTPAIAQLMQRLGDLDSARGAEYMKIVGDRLVCAAGLRGNGDSDHARVLAALALEIQDACQQISLGSSRRLDFKIGVDTGTAMGSSVGREQETYNIWGDAVRTAERMAESGVQGEIHVSESTYHRTRSRFLFRLRGRFYIPGVGELSTYILTGSL